MRLDRMHPRMHLPNKGAKRSVRHPWTLEICLLSLAQVGGEGMSGHGLGWKRRLLPDEYTVERFAGLSFIFLELGLRRVPRQWPVSH